MSTDPKVFLTPQQYLEIERGAEYRSEYYNGEMFAMAGATLDHNQIVGNTLTNLSQQLRGGRCRIVASDLRVRVSATGLYTYPDLVAWCGPPQLLDQRRDTLLNPTLIVEVLSPSTEAYDRGRKFDHYKTIDSLSEYLLISSDRIHADLFLRQPGGDWLLKSADRLEDTLELQAIACRVSLAGIYGQVELQGSRTTE